VKVSEADYTAGNDYVGSAPDLRDDGDYGVSAGATYAVTPQIIVALTYNYDQGRNLLGSLPAKYFPDYRDFSHNIWALDIKYKF
jgi:opacity protein-like surface antigen